MRAARSSNHELQCNPGNTIRCKPQRVKPRLQTVVALRRSASMPRTVRVFGPGAKVSDRSADEGYCDSPLEQGSLQAHTPTHRGA